MANNENAPELTNGQFEEFIKEGLVLIDFFAEWCMPCVMMGPFVEELAEKFSGKIKFGKVNVDDNEAASQKFQVSSIPTFILIRNGEVIERIVGSIAEEEFEEILEKHI